MNLSLLEDLEIQETKIRVIFNYKIENFGFLIGDGIRDIEPGEKVKVPIYIAKFLLDNDHCTLVDPILSENIKNDIRANSTLINLRSLYSHFYSFVSLFESNEYITKLIFTRYNYFYKLILKEKIDEDDLYLLENSEKQTIVVAKKNYMEYREYFVKY